MKLTKEDIQKYGTEEEKKFLKEMSAPKKKVVLQMRSSGDNIYAYFAAFQRGAERAGWTKKEIAKVMDEAKSGDYDHAVETILKYSV